MALIGNMTAVNKSFAMFYMGIAGNNIANSTNTSYQKTRQLFFPFESSLGQGYNLGDVDIGPISPGGLASINRCEGSAVAEATALRVKTASGSSDGVATASASLAVLTQGAGVISGAATVSGSIAAVSSLSGSTSGAATTTASLKSNVPLAGSVAGAATVSANLTGIANASGTIEVGAAVGLTAGAVANAVWNEVIESGYSSSDILKVLAAFAAGKTSITALGGGDATVVFRDLGDTKDRIEAGMEGSERTSVTLDTV